LLEARAELLGTSELGVEDLDGVAPADLVLADVDGRHAADAEQALERPLAAQCGAEYAPHIGG
jgi:hypothetical protein